MSKKSKNELAQKILRDRGLSPAEEGEATARQENYDLEDALIPKYAVQVLSTPLLVKFAKGEINMERMARSELANRGLDVDGKWVGCDTAEHILKKEKEAKK